MNNNFHVEMNEYLPLRDVVFTTLRQAILKGELEPGERLMEIQLAQRLGVSRTPVREAIRKLELEGLVLMIPRRGAEVARITIQDMEDVLEVRGALEALAVKDACLNNQEELLNDLEVANKDFQEGLEKDDIIACVQRDMHFHEVIYNATKNHRLLQLLTNLREQMYRYRMEYLKDVRIHAALVDEHGAIIEAIKNKDVQGAIEAVHNHIENQKATILNSLTEKE